MHLLYLVTSGCAPVIQKMRNNRHWVCYLLSWDFSSGSNFQTWNLSLSSVNLNHRVCDFCLCVAKYSCLKSLVFFIWEWGFFRSSKKLQMALPVPPCFPPSSFKFSCASKHGCVDFGLGFYLVVWFGFLLWVFFFFSKAKSAAWALWDSYKKMFSNPLQLEEIA